jgi:hypothetical protein
MLLLKQATGIVTMDVNLQNAVVKWLKKEISKKTREENDHIVEGDVIYKLKTANLLLS